MNQSIQKSRRTSKTLVELTIGVIGILAVMFAQLGAKNNVDADFEQLSTHQQIKLVSIIGDELATNLMPSNGKVGWFSLLF